MDNTNQVLHPKHHPTNTLSEQATSAGWVWLGRHRSARVEGVGGVVAGVRFVFSLLRVFF